MPDRRTAARASLPLLAAVALAVAAALAPDPARATAPDAALPASDGVAFLADALARYPLVLLGNTHRRAEILAFERRALGTLARRAGLTHVGLEIDTDQQAALDRFLRTGRGLDAVRVSPGIDSPEFRAFLVGLRPLSRPAGGRIEVVALDRPRAAAGGLTRDAHMARAIAGVFERAPRARMVVLVGNNHALRDATWSRGGTARFIPGELAALRPDLAVMSVHHCVDDGEPTELRRDLRARLPVGDGPWAVPLHGPLASLADDSTVHLSLAPRAAGTALQDAVLFYASAAPEGGGAPSRHGAP